MRRRMGRAIVFTAIFWSITTVTLGLVGAQTPVQPAPASRFPSNPSAATRSAVQKPNGSGGWRNYHFGETQNGHFGESPSAPPAEPRPYRQFAQGGVAPPSLQQVPPGRNPAVNRFLERGSSGPSE